MQLNKENITSIKPGNELSIPPAEVFSYPEKVLQFGTGVLLRGLPDYFIDKANSRGIFRGRVVVVKSTSTGTTDEFQKNDNLYTVCVKGIENNELVDEKIINASISRVLSATGSWNEVLKCASDPGIRIIISNTTEAGLTLDVSDSINAQPPVSFPGKLLACLYKRYKAFNGDGESGFVIIPTELIPGNGAVLKDIVLKLAELNQCEAEFITWIEQSNHFCNSLVDRIVPGKLPGAEQAFIEEKLGYHDDLMIMAEPYRLWAIEGNDKVKQVLPFAEADSGVIVTSSIDKFRELKLRLLNGTHTFSCAVAFLSGFSTVKEAMNDKIFQDYVYRLMMDEIVDSIESTATREEAVSFALQVIDRFRNPYIEHKWLSISMQYSLKMKMRNLPLIFNYVKEKNSFPPLMTLGFSAYVYFMKCRKGADGDYSGICNSSEYKVQDDKAPYFAEQWAQDDTEMITQNILANIDLWGDDLNTIPGFASQVAEYLGSIDKYGMRSTLEKVMKLSLINATV